jgi:hypothetical protein
LEKAGVKIEILLKLILREWDVRERSGFISLWTES